ncbi:alkaline-phosphatase-like protein [Halteromyces radiatus]|uniref:alkaline-phosphatase-like protein n=1 Tax=Halteromyces radiatus TaxID=101107 RepID=UPI00221EC49E|nr:alkaline-phosphatase-like protein [Halteromyces radiatus]KAI8086207.1 alkaline-phosphatase-like protein [Halteromyces radiatus]
MSSNKNYNAIPETEEQPLNGISLSPIKTRRNRIISGLVICIGSVIIITTSFYLLTGNNATPKRNVIMMISDGFGPASETYARQYHQWREGLEPKNSMLPLDEIHVGHSRTQSSSSLVTDSAAGATAFSCGLKTYNGAIGVDPSKQPCGTVLESAKHHHDMLTGLVVTSRITHATPASFSAHIEWRDWEPAIAEHQIGHNPLGRSVDLMFGGGSCEFLSNSTTGSCRADQRDLFKEAQDQFGWTVKRTRQEFDNIKPDDSELPLMAIFTPQHMSYEIDRNPSKEPSLKEMTTKALSILSNASKRSDRGFFLMIEGSRIDMAAHSNDPASHLHDIMEYQRTVEVVKEFVRNNPNTVVISTSDHETGGLTLGRQVGEDYPEYKWNPEVISRVMNSSEHLANVWNQATETNIASLDYLKSTIIADGLGVTDPSKEELDKVMAWKTSGKPLEVLVTYFGDIVSRRALIGWTTWGHTGVDVNLYALGENAQILRGSHENTEIGDFIVNYLGLDLDDITQRLTKGSNFSQTFKTNDYTNMISDHQRYNN